MSEAQLVSVVIEVNGRSIAARVEPRLLLVDFLRDNAGVKSTRIACEEGACGACTVELNGRTVKSCLVLAVGADGGHVATVESLSQGRELSPLQEAFVGCNAMQCGYCTAGMVMSARAFLKSRGDAPFSDEDIRHALSGNLCRCTGYLNILQAVKVAAGRAEPFARADAPLPAGAAWIGQPVARREDRRLVAGRGRYCDNYSDSHSLHAVAVRAERAHARIRHIDTARAKDMPGVHLVMTGAEAQSHWNPIVATIDMVTLNLPHRYAMAVDKVIFYGEPLALVVADTPYQAEDAARAVTVEYEDLPVNVDALAAATVGADSAALVYPAWQTNLQIEHRFSHGDVDGAFAAADLVVDEHIVSHRFGSQPLETRVVLASFEPGDERLTVRSSTQIPHQTRMYLSKIFGLPETRIQVLADDVGGAFGAKLSVDCELLPVLASIMLGRPVMWFESRSEWMHSGPAARDYHTRSRAAFRRDGSLLAMETDILADMGVDGAERAAGLGMPLNGGNYAPGPYVLDTYRTHIRCVVTNKAPYSAYRGYGKDLANMLMERVLDQAAERLEIDPLEIRRRNLLRRYPHQVVTGPIIEHGSVRESLDRLAEVMDVPGLRAEQARALAEGRHLGLCMVPYIEPSGFAFPGSAFQNYESVAMRIQSDGSVRVMTGMQNIGQGIETSYAQVVADALGAPLQDVSIAWGDTTSTPWGSGTFSSRGAMFAVGAIVDAADKLRSRMLTGAANLLGVERAAIVVDNGVFRHPPSGKAMSFAELAYACYVQPGSDVVLAGADAPLLEAIGTYRHPQVNWTPDALGRIQVYSGHANGAAGALVEVDVETGRVDVLKIWMVADHGVVLNPLVLAGQIKGGVVQQLGGTLYEVYDYDEHGRPRASTLKEYGMPTVWAAPEIEIHHLSTPATSNRIGSKGGGEDGCIATSTVLMGAVEDALRPLGVKVMSSPLSPSRIRAMIEAASGTAP